MSTHSLPLLYYYGQNYIITDRYIYILFTKDIRAVNARFSNSDLHLPEGKKNRE